MASMKHLSPQRLIRFHRVLGPVCTGKSILYCQNHAVENISLGVGLGMLYAVYCILCVVYLMSENPSQVVWMRRDGMGWVGITWDELRCAISST